MECRSSLARMPSASALTFSAKNTHGRHKMAGESSSGPSMLWDARLRRRREQWDCFGEWTMFVVLLRVLDAT